MSIKESILIANEIYNQNNGKNGYHSKVLTSNDISDTVELYKTVYEILQKQGNEKFIHPLNEEDVEKFVSSKDEAILGYFKGKQLMGALYTKPFEQNNPYFITPSYDEGKTSFTLGGLAVNPNFRGQGVITKLSKIIYGGVKDFATKNPEENISGIGAEISCENFNSLSSAKILTDDKGNNLLNFCGIHYMPGKEDTDLTVLGYHSFLTEQIIMEDLPNVILNGVQKDSFVSLENALQIMAEKTNGLTQTTVGEHLIETLDSPILAPYSDVFTFDKGEQQQ